MKFEHRRVKDTVIVLLRACLLLCAFWLIFLSFISISDFGISNSVNDKVSSTQTQKIINTLEYKIVKHSDCETVHIAIICGGHNATRDFYTLIKSILFYRSNVKLQLHLFIDNVSKKITQELFHSWQVPHLSIDYYRMADYELEIAWIPNQHYSHRYGLLKLVVPSILAAANVERVIFLDTDVFLLGDIAQLWKEFTKLDQTNNALFGMVENQSDWYLKNQSHQLMRAASWPAIGRGFNTGMMLIDISRLKKVNWGSMWRELAEMELISHLATSLADQDIYNAIIKRNYWIVARLDCNYNLQLNDHTNPNSICPSHKSSSKGFKLIHWNSRYKLDTRNSMAKHYKNWYETFINWNGKLLQGGADCSNSDSTTNTSLIEPVDFIQDRLEEACQDIRPRPNEKLRTFLYFLDFKFEDMDIEVDFDVSVVVHLSVDRLRALDELATHWEGPISAAIYLNEMDISLFHESIQNSESLSKRLNVGYHLVFRDFGFNYPINRLRNIALNNALTPFVFMIDVDFLPAFGLYDYLKQMIKEMTNDGRESHLAKKVLVIPAFENREYKFDFPARKNELIGQSDLGTVFKFRDTIWPQGQAATDYGRWRLSTKPYQIDWKPEYEPYLVTDRNIPRFDERFNGFGWNKVEHTMQLAAMNYSFFVLPEAFIIHQFHSASYDISRHRESKKYQMCIRLLKERFLMELRLKYPEFMDKLRRRSLSEDSR